MVPGHGEERGRRVTALTTALKDPRVRAAMATDGAALVEQEIAGVGYALLH